MARAKTLLVTTVKNEGPYILEWVAWHRLCGFDDILVLQNDSTDLTQRTLRVLGQIGAITYMPNTGQRSSPQIRAYQHASASRNFAEADWCLTIDGDEFFVGRVGGGTVNELTKRIHDADAMLINWRNFGNSGQLDLSDGLQAERFTWTCGTDNVIDRLTGFKTLFRTSAFARIGIHNAKVPKKPEQKTVNGSGLSEPDFQRLNWRCRDPGGMALAQISHFPIRDVSSFVLKTLRGRGHQNQFDDWEQYWRKFDVNLEEDRTLADRGDDIRAEMARLDDLAGGRLMGIRARSLRFWKAALNTALEDPETRAFYERIKELAVGATA